MILFFFFKQKTAYEMRISDWSSDVCSSDLFRVASRVALVSRGRQGAGGSLGLDPGLAALLKGWTLSPPPLRERVDDLSAVMEALAGGRGSGLPRRKDFTAAAMKQLAAHGWPLNETELHNLLGALAGRREGGPVQLQQLLPLL